MTNRIEPFSPFLEHFFQALENDPGKRSKAATDGDVGQSDEPFVQDKGAASTPANPEKGPS